MLASFRQIRVIVLCVGLVSCGSGPVRDSTSFDSTARSGSDDASCEDIQSCQSTGVSCEGLDCSAAVGTLDCEFCRPSDEVVLFDDFNSGFDTSNWRIAKRQWGGKDVNGGVVPENVAVRDGLLILEAHGDLYDGDVRGLERGSSADNDRRIEHGRRVGGAVATSAYFGSGRYEARVKIVGQLGVASAMWVFNYQEFYDGQSGYSECLDTHPRRGNFNDGYYCVINHEIDIEFPGRLAAPIEDFSFDHGLFSTYVGETGSQHQLTIEDAGASLDDGAFHLLRFDWHVGDSSRFPRVDFFIDGRLVARHFRHVPFFEGRFWLGAWFPHLWAGTPNFDTEFMLVDWVRITRWSSAQTEFRRETYDESGWALPEEYPPNSF